MTFTIILLAPWAAVAAFGNELARLNDQGNAFYGEKKYDEALERYRAAQLEAPESKELFYNIAKTLARQEKYDDAAKEYEKVTAQPDPSLYANARYDAGVMSFREAERLIGEQKYQEALKKLEGCMAANQEAMRANRNDEDPKYNYEMAKRRYKEVMQKLKDQQQQQQQQEQNQQGQDQKDKQSQPQEQQKGQQQEQELKQEQQDKDKEQQKGRDEKKEEEKQGGGQEQNAQQAQQGGEEDKSKQQPQEMTAEDARQLLNTAQDEDKDALKRSMKASAQGFDMKNDW